MADKTYPIPPLPGRTAAQLTAGLEAVEPAVAAETRSCEIYNRFVADEQAGRIQAPTPEARDRLVVDRLMEAQRVIGGAVNGKWGNMMFPDYALEPPATRAAQLRSDLGGNCRSPWFAFMRERLRVSRPAQ